MSEKQVPFFFWECITLNLKKSDVYIVIKNEKRMNDFIKFLIYNLKTIDGHKDSALKIHEQLLTQKWKQKYDKIRSNKNDEIERM